MQKEEEEIEAREDRTGKVRQKKKNDKQYERERERQKGGECKGEG